MYLIGENAKQANNNSFKSDVHKYREEYKRKQQKQNLIQLPSN